MLLMIELINDNCMNVMAKYPDKYFDLAIVDPPYGIGMDKKNAHSNIRDNDKWANKNWDEAPPNAEYFAELKRVSKNQIIWGGNYFLDHLGSTQCFLVWDKGVRDFSLADAELAWTSFKSSVRIKTIHRSQLQVEGGKTHPTQKPKKLYNWILKHYAKPTDKILDTHLGSGSIAVCCHYFGCDLVGTEIDTDYYNEAMKRFKNETCQLTLI
jgi:site-specific DNA-methyltransferase (adenine-specific)